MLQTTELENAVKAEIVTWAQQDRVLIQCFPKRLCKDQTISQ